MSLENTSSGSEVFREFIRDRRVLIADGSSVTRVSLYNILTGLGAKAHQISMVSSFTQATEEMARFKPQVVIAEFEISNRCGIDLVQAMRELNPVDTKECIFMVVASNTSQSAVARAAEEDVDAYIVKPYTQDTVKRSLIRAALSKVRPSEYAVAIDKGKSKKASREYEEAERMFDSAMKLDPVPTLACYYLGQVKEIRERKVEAKTIYTKGVELNNSHYKCNLGLYELHVKEKNFVEAYDVIKRISHYFPNNPKRLSEVLRLAIVNQRYEDIEQYYTAFRNMEDREDGLIKHVCAALIVCGKYFLRAGDSTKAFSMFQKATTAGTGRTRILKEVIEALVENGFAKEASEFLAKFPHESRSGEDYLNSRVHVASVADTGDRVISEGRDLVARGIADERTYAVMIQALAKGSHELAAEELAQKAAHRFPAKKQQFEDLAKNR